MKKHLVSFCSILYYKSQERLIRSAKENGIESFFTYNDKWLRKEREFYSRNKWLLNFEKGNGYWVWKPYIILKALNQIKEGDILIYSDSGIAIKRPLDELVKITCNNDGLTVFATHKYKNSQFTKRDCFFYMGCDKEEFHNGSQAMSGFIVLKKVSRVIDIIEEWLQYNSDIRIASDLPNTCGLPNFNDYIDHRYDQSIFSLLAIKYGIEFHRDPSQWGNPWKMQDFREPGEFLDIDYVQKSWTNSPYPTLLDVHRTRNKTNLLHKINYYILNR